MSQQIYLGVDLGAESGRLMAGLWDGRTMQIDELHRFPNTPVQLAGTLRWDVPRLWSDLEHGLAVAASRFGHAIQSIGVDTWGVDYVLLSKSRELLGLPFHYRDARTRGLVEDTCRLVPREDIFAASGTQFMDINTLCQLMAHRRHSPEILAMADRFFMIPDFLNWALCGSDVSEFTNASTTQFFHPVSRQWSFELLQKAGLPTRIFPAVVEPGTRLGSLRPGVAARAGLGQVEVIAPATHDTASAVAAVPTLNTGRPNWAYISSGTWSLLGVEVQHAIISPSVLARNVTNEGGVDHTYRLLKNIMGLWLLQQCRASFQRRKLQHDYASLASLAEAAPPLRSLINPDDPRFLNPVDMPEAIAGFCLEAGLPVPKTEGEITRCVLESLALKYSLVLGWIEELTGCRTEVVHVVGGGSRNALLNQFTAEACQRQTLAGPVEATVLGNLLIQARAFGEISSLPDLRLAVRASCEVHEFTPSNSSAWSEARARMRDLCSS